LKTLTKLLQLHNIVLVESSICSALDPRSLGNAVVGQKTYALNLGEARWWLDGAALDVLLGYRITAFLSRDAKQLELLTVTASFVASYALPDNTKIATEDRDSLMADLVAANGQINVFPYLRQLVVDMTSRTGWPPLVLNVFKAPAKRPRDLVRMARAWDTSATG
jgi:hypothetical protein